MSDTDASGLWPKPDTLKAGDEELVTDPDPRSTDNSDGHLEAEDYWRKHPDA